MKNSRGLNHSSLYLKFTFALFILYSVNIHAQDSDKSPLNSIKKKSIEAYGVDYNLVNGVKYIYFYAKSAGHPWFKEPEFGNGWIEIDGKRYEDQTLNYDIYNQQVIVEYESGLIGTQRFIVPDLHLDGFSLEGREFRKMKIGNRNEQIYEIVSSGEYSLIYSHTKSYTISRSTYENNYRFSENVEDHYLLHEGKLLRFRNKRAFRRLFPRELQDEIKSYIKSNRINFKKSDITEIKSLMEYINAIL